MARLCSSSSLHFASLRFTSLRFACGIRQSKSSSVSRSHSSDNREEVAMTLEMILRTAGLESLAPRLRAAGVTDPRQLSDSLLQQLGVDDAAARAALLQAMARVADPLVAGGATMHAAAPGPSTPLSLDALAIGATMHEGVAQASAMSDTDRATSNSREPAVRDAIGEGTKLNGRYYLVKEIGRGAMGVVYKAIDEATKEECAIKVILPELADSPGIVDLMIQEAARAQKLRSEHLLSINHVETGHQPFIVMEYVDGGTLTDLWRDHRRQMPPADVQRILGQVLEGLTFLHGRKLIHRDIKPDNIMIGRDGSVKVADYGVAASLREQRRNSQAAGTPVYMAPELLAGDPDVDGRADLYALGMMGHQLLLGGFPFTGTSLDDIRAWHSSPRRDLGALTAAPCGAVFAKALSHDPRERFQSAGEMREALLATAANSGAPAPFVGSAPIPSFATAPTIPPASPPPPATVPPPDAAPVTPVVAVRSSAESSPARGRSVGLPLMAVALAIVGGGIWQWRSSTGREETARAAELQKQVPATTAIITTTATTTKAPNTTTTAAAAAPTVAAIRDQKPRKSSLRGACARQPSITVVANANLAASEGERVRAVLQSAGCTPPPVKTSLQERTASIVYARDVNDEAARSVAIAAGLSVAKIDWPTTSPIVFAVGTDRPLLGENF